MLRYLIAYDITDDKIRTRVFKFLCKNAQRLQKSVFLFEGSGNSMAGIQKWIAGIMDDTDSLAVIPVSDACYAKAVVISGDLDDSTVAA
ncbi:MAG: CRISPR-associated endonuclease Cas2 [Succinivibrio sp.]